MMPISLTLIRHGESESNFARHAWARGTPLAREEELMRVHTSERRLTARGREQAQRAGQWLKSNLIRWNQRDFTDGYFRFCVSPYVRAMETAGYFAFDNYYRFRQDFRLVERNWGNLDHLPYAERVAQFGDEMQKRWDHAFFWRAGDGETMQDVVQRVKDFLATLYRECSDMHVLVVCHGETMWAFRYILEYWTPQRLREELNARDERVAIHNCRIIQYTRMPRIGPPSNRLIRVRFVDPLHPDDPERNLSWQQIERPLFTSSDLLDIVDRYPAFIEEPTE